MTRRGQAAVVGVALLLAVTVVAVGVLTAGVGTVVDERADRAALDAAASELRAAFTPAAAAGPGGTTLDLPPGTLDTVPREVRVYRDGSLVATVQARALVFRRGGGSARLLAGRVVATDGGWTEPYRSPPLVAGGEGRPLAIRVPRFTSEVDAGGGTRRAEVDARHRERDLGRGRFSVAVETSTPGAWTLYFERRGATTERRDVDGDGVPSVRATLPGTHRGVLVVHSLAVTVRD